MSYWRLFWTLTITGLAGAVLAGRLAEAQSSLPPGFEDVPIVSGLAVPTAMAFTPDGRLFVCEQGGGVRIFKDGVLNSTPFVTLAVTSNGERGVLGIAFHPDFPAEPYVYLYYTTGPGSKDPPPAPKNRVSRFIADGDAARPGSEEILVDGIPSDLGFHNAGCLRFAQDGKLYISTGDGGLFPRNSQDLGSLGGKILRVNADGSIPGDNPFVGQAGARGEIYCYGLRNPFRFTFRPGTNTLYIADVGASLFEEINVGFPGANFGWPDTEGPTTAAGITPPLYYYAHTVISASVTGGCFLDSPNFPVEYRGSYFFGDYVRSSISRLVVTPTDTLVSAEPFAPAANPVDFAQGPDGDLYYLSISQGTVREIRSLIPYSIAGTPGSVAPGETLTVAWTAPAGRPWTDWVGLYRRGDPNTAYVWWTYTGGARSGSASLAAPAAPGEYELRYLPDNGYVEAAVSAPVTITAPAAASYSLTPAPASQTAGAPLSIGWTAPAGSSSWDWIGLFRAADPNSGEVWWTYTGGAASGIRSLTAPLSPGEYEFRYLLNNGRTDVKRTAVTITAPAAGSYTLTPSTDAVSGGGGLSITWGAPPGSAPFDWIGLFPVGSPNTGEVWWNYTWGAASGTYDLTAPTTPGQYEFRYFPNNTRSPVKVSGPVSVN